ncbi:MAG: trehalose-6-phosphate synthase [Methanobacterium sp.]|nr:trehalose-6-phosphate synthase [Methanobacterium sp.]
MSVDPYDINGTSKAIYNAVNMNENDKNQNSLGLKNIIKNHTITDWLSEQITDINNKF